MRSMINGIAAELGGSIKWCSRTHLTKKTDELMAAHLKKANAILKTDIVDVPNAKCGVTFDAGQAKNGHSFLALTIHWMTFEAGPSPRVVRAEKPVDALVPTSAAAAAPPTALSSGAVVELVGRFSVKS